MSRIVAIDWDRHQARAAVLDTSAIATRLVRLVSVPRQAGQSPGEALAAALADTPLGKAQAVVAVGRDHLQLKLAQVPPVPANELPDLIRFQADRELTNLGSEAVVDYLVLSEETSGPSSVLMAAISAEGLAEVARVGRKLDLEPQHVGLRAASAVSLVARHVDFEPAVPSLVVLPLAEEAELALVADGKVMLLRTVRLPVASEPPHAEPDGPLPATEASLQSFMAVGLGRREAALASEIRRTLAAGRQQLAGAEVEAIYICSSGELLPTQLLSEQLGVATVAVDPLAIVAGHKVVVEAGDRPQHAGRLAAVLGLGLDVAERQPLAFDFLHPRKAEEKQPIKRVHILAAAAAAVFALMVVFSLYQQLVGPRRELAKVRAQIRTHQEVADQYADVVAQAQSVERWLATDVNWLDELERLARQVRPASPGAPEFDVSGDVLLRELYARTNTGNQATGGRIGITAVGRSPAAVGPLERRLSDASHLVTARVVDQDQSVDGYPARFELDVDVQPSESEAEAAP